MEHASPDLLTEFIEEPQLIQASTGKRFANFLIDYVVFLLLMVVVGIVWAIVSPDTVSGLSNDAGFGIIDRIVTVLLYALYIGFIEAITKGRSLGKLITGTKAVNEDGSAITPATAFKRGLSRAVPFELFSAFGSPSYPWHDKWNRTYVIDIKQSHILTGTDLAS